MSIKINAIREHLGMKQIKFAEVLDVSQPTYSRMEKGEVPLSEDMLKFLFIEKRISPLWYFYDMGPMLFDEEEKIVNRERSERAYKMAQMMADQNNAQMYFYHQIMYEHFKEKMRREAES